MEKITLGPEKNSREKKEIVNPLEKFKKKIKKIKEKEAKEGQTVHLRDCRPELLQDKDREIYEKFEKGVLSLEEFREYQYRLKNLNSFEEPDEQKKQIIESQKHFCAWIANRMQPRIYKEYRKKHEEYKKHRKIHSSEK